MANILIVDDDISLQQVLEIACRKKKWFPYVAADSKAAWTYLENYLIDLILLDLKLGQESGLDFLKRVKQKYPQVPVIMITAFAETKSAIEAIKLGAVDYLPKPFDLDELFLTIERVLDEQRLKKENLELKQKISRYRSEQIIGSSPKMLEIFELVQQIGPTAMNVIIVGESGTGKELIARQIHKTSARKDRPFVPINCGAIPEHLFESELFGYVKGAFTGADRTRRGLLEEANGGTIFLDEITDLPLSMQVKLLRCIQEKSFRPVGGVEEKKIDVRFLAATNTNILELVKKNKFREDLFYRLSGVIINLPPLRSRGNDLIELAYFFLKRSALDQNKKIKGFSQEALKKLKNYSYPGNVRELQTIIERAVALETKELIQPTSLIMYESIKEEADDKGYFSVLRGEKTLDEYLLEQEKKVLQEALAVAKNKTEAAKLLGLNLRQFRYRLQRVGLD